MLSKPMAGDEAKNSEEKTRTLCKMRKGCGTRHSALFCRCSTPLVEEYANPDDYEKNAAPNASFADRSNKIGNSGERNQTK